MSRLLNVLVALRWLGNSRRFIRFVGRAPRYIDPKDWTDKMQWRKVFDTNPLFGIYTDKVDVRRHANALRPGISYPEFLWVGDSVENIPFSDFNCSYVVKPAIGSGQYRIVHDPESVDTATIMDECRQWMGGRDYGRSAAERGYWGRKNRIIIEKFLPALTGEDGIGNWKFFVFNGRVGYVQLESCRAGVSFLTFFGRDGERWPVAKWVGRYPFSKMDQPDDSATVPERFPELVADAEALASDVDHIRVDLYDFDGKTWLSELTPYEGSGYSYLYRQDSVESGVPSRQMDSQIGALWTLPKMTIGRLLKTFLPTYLTMRNS